MSRIASPFAALLAVGSLLAAVSIFAQSENQPGQGQAVLTVVPNKNAPAPTLTAQQMNIKVDGKESNIANLKPFGPDSRVELAILIDGASRTSLGNQFSDIEHFVQALPPNTRAALAYMENGRAEFTGPFSADRADTLRGLRLTGMGVPGISASPYFCLADLANHWPSNDRSARREVVMITDGVDYYDLRYDPEDPYVQTAINQSVRAHLIVFTIYWRNEGRIDRSWYETDAGQNLLFQVTGATGGNSYWQGLGNPVSLQPYLEDIGRRLGNQYELSFLAPSSGRTEVETFKLKAEVSGAKIDAPQEVLVLGSEMANER